MNELEMLITARARDLGGFTVRRIHRYASPRMDGIQCWVALPEEHEEIEPSFAHHPSHTLPVFNVGSTEIKLLLGHAFGRSSPVRVHSDLLYAEAKIPAGARLLIPSEQRECA